MKIVRLLLVITACLVLAHPAMATVKLSIGGTVGYTWWKPSWNDAKSLTRFWANEGTPWTMTWLRLDEAGDYRTSANVMGGPVLSLSFLERWSISTVFIIGRYSFEKTSPGRSMYSTVVPGLLPPTIVTYPFVDHVHRDTLKWDSDSSVSFAVNRFFKVFAGFKVQSYTYEQHLNLGQIQNNQGQGTLNVRDLTSRMLNYGPGLGVGVTIPLVDNLVLAANFSVLVLWGVERINVHQSHYVYLFSGPSVPGGLAPMYTPPGKTLSYGFNSTLALAYLIERINTTVQVGGRYQLLYNRQKFRNAFDSDVSLDIIDKQYDHFFGVTMSVIYTFTFGKGQS